MKFIIIIITVIVAYFLLKIDKSAKEKTNKANNMILCKKCGYHVPQKLICDDSTDIDKCPNNNER